MASEGKIRGDVWALPNPGARLVRIGPLSTIGISFRRKSKGEVTCQIRQPTLSALSPRTTTQVSAPTFFVDYADDLSARVAALRPESVLELAAGTGAKIARRIAG